MNVIEKKIWREKNKIHEAHILLIFFKNANSLQ